MHFIFRYVNTARNPLTSPSFDNIYRTGFVFMMTSSNGNIYCVTGPLWAEFHGHRWIPLIKASDVGFWCFLWSAPEQTFQPTIERPVISDAVTLIITSPWCLCCGAVPNNMLFIDSSPLIIQSVVWDFYFSRSWYFVWSRFPLAEY